MCSSLPSIMLAILVSYVLLLNCWEYSMYIHTQIRCHLKSTYWETPPQVQSLRLSPCQEWAWSWQRRTKNKKWKQKNRNIKDNALGKSGLGVCYTMSSTFSIVLAKFNSQWWPDWSNMWILKVCADCFVRETKGIWCCVHEYFSSVLCL